MDSIRSNAKKGTLCGKIQNSSTVSALSYLLWRISDKTHSGEGGYCIIELLRRLLFLRGFKHLQQEYVIDSLARLAEYLHYLKAIEDDEYLLNDTTLSSRLDHVVQLLLKGDAFFYAEDCNAFSSSPLPSLISTTVTKKNRSEIDKAIPVPVYPALWIDVAHIIKTVRHVAPSNVVQLIIARFIEKVYCRIADHSHSTPVVSKIVCVLDFQNVVDHETFHSGYTFAAIRLISEPLWAYAPVIIHNIIVYGARKAHEVFWRPLMLGLNPYTRFVNDNKKNNNINGDYSEIEQHSVRVMLCETKEELNSCIGSNWMRRRPTFGGFEDPTTQRYTCDFGKTLKDHLAPGAFMLDNFWKNAPVLAERMKRSKRSSKEQQRIKTCKDRNICYQKPTTFVTTTGLNNKSSCVTTLQNINAIQCAGHLQTRLEAMGEDIKKDLQLTDTNNDNVSSSIDIKPYIREAAAKRALGIKPNEKSFTHPPPSPLACKINTRCIYTPFISRESNNLCNWKRLGYAQLHRVIS